MPAYGPTHHWPTWALCLMVTNLMCEIFLCVIKLHVRCNVHVVVGDDSLESALNEEESLCMDKVYDALDWYKKAVIETREIEVCCNSILFTL